MKAISFLLNVLFFPFDLLGQMLALVCTGLLKLFVPLLRSPWGLLLPCTLIIALLLTGYLSQNASELAQLCLQELENCDENRVPNIIARLVQLDEAGIPSLVSALGQPRVAVVSEAQNALNAEMERWEQWEEPQRIQRYRVLSQALLRNVPTMDAESRNMAMRLGQRMLRNLALTSSSQQDRTAKDTDKNARKDALATTQNCERLFAQLEISRQSMPASENTLEGDSDSPLLAARYENRGDDGVLVASMDRPLQNTDDTPVDTLSARSERLYAYHDSPAFRQQMDAPYHRPGLIPPGAARSMPSTDLSLDGMPAVHAEPASMIASMKPLRSDAPALRNVQNSSIFPTLAETQSKVANSYRPTETVPPGIAANYLQKYGEKYRATPEKADSTPPTTENGLGNVFVPTELRDTPLEQISSLTAEQLMRLLQHTDERYVAEARKTLIARDGFRDIHLKLAYRLFHPVPAVREEVISMLSATAGVQPRVWLSVLLNDPSGDVRYRAASYLATAGDPALRQLLIERGKRDTDSRIVNLADRLAEEQRRSVLR